MYNGCFSLPFWLFSLFCLCSFLKLGSVIDLSDRFLCCKNQHGFYADFKRLLHKQISRYSKIPNSRFVCVHGFYACVVFWNSIYAVKISIETMFLLFWAGTGSTGWPGFRTLVFVIWCWKICSSKLYHKHLSLYFCNENDTLQMIFFRIKM